MNKINFGTIDKEAGVLYSVVICEEGEAKGHEQWLDPEFIIGVVAKGQETGEIGLKCRFNHPNMCAGALGTYVGRLKNFSLSVNEEGETKAIADLYLDECCKISPNGNLFDYILSVATTSPDMLGMSIAFKEDMMECGKKKKQFDDGSEMPIPTIESLYACDLVDEPAATEQLFDTTSFAAKVTEFLDRNPKIYELFAANPQVIADFLPKYEKYLHKIEQKQQQKTETMSKEQSKFGAWFSEMFGSTKENETFATEMESQITELQSLTEDLQTKFEAVEAEKAELLATIETLNAEKVQFEAEKSEVEALKAELNEIKSTYSAPNQETQFKSVKDNEIDKMKQHIENKTKK